MGARVDQAHVLGTPEIGFYPGNGLGCLDCNEALVAATGTVTNARYPAGARDNKSSVPAGDSPEVIFASPAGVTSRSVSNRKARPMFDKSFGVAHACSPPDQKLCSLVEDMDHAGDLADGV